MRKIRLLFTVALSLIAWTGVMAQSGTGAQNDPFVVKTAAELNNLRNLLVSGSMNYVVMENDVDMAAIDDWFPLFNNMKPYPQIDFDGKGHVISNLISKTDGAYDYCGLFGVLCGNVRNLGVKNAEVTCTGGTGIIAGYLGHSEYGKTCYVENVWVTGKLTASGYCGGMFGNIANESHITNCYANVEVTGSSDLTGGIIGRVRAKVEMTNVYAAGSINQGGGIIGGGFQAATALGTYKNVAVWNNTAKNFGPAREGEELSSIFFYDGSNFAEMQKQVVAWDSKAWYCDMKEGSYPVLVDFLDPETKLTAQYEAALPIIEDGSVYGVKTNVNGTYYYLKADGTLTTTESEAGKYIFQKVKGSAYEYGFKLNSNGSFFSNPPGTSEGNLKSGKLNTSTRGDNSWEAQVFFLKDNKYAVRSTNAAYATSGWNWVGSAFWTVAIAEVPVAQYDFAPQYIWELEKDELATQQVYAFNVVKSWPYYVQTVKGLVKDPAYYSSNAVEPSEGSIANLLDNDYASFFHSCWSSGPDEDHYLQAELPEATQTFQFYFKKRQQNNNNRPTTIVLSASNDGKTFEDVKVLNEGFPTEETAIDYISDVIDLGSAYKYVRFTVTGTNTPDKKCNNHLFFTFSEFYMYPTVDAATEAFKVFKATTSATDLTEADIENINAVDAALKDALKTVKVTYVVKNGLGNEVFKSDPITVKAGEQITGLPAEYKRAFTKYSDVDVIVNEDATIEFTETWDGPIQLSTSAADAKWYNMTIRSDFSVFVDATEPYYPKTATPIQKATDEYQWAFAGDAYAFVVFNKAKGLGYSLTKDGSNVVMREGSYAWEINPNSDGFTLKEIGTDYNCVNQNGGATGPLQFWNSAWSPSDNGSTFRISEVPTSFEWTVGEAGYATMYVPINAEAGDGVTAYTGVVYDEFLALNEIEGAIPAGTPVVLKAAPGTYTFAIDNTILNVAKACELTNALADKATSEEIYSVVGYVTNLYGKPNAKNQQSFYIADTPEGGKDFEAYLTSLPEGVETFVVGQKVKITGKLYKYVSSKGLVTLEISNPAVVIYDNDLKGTYEEIDAAGKYVLAKPAEKQVGFYLATSGKIAAGKAFLELREGDPEIKAFYFNGDAETAIETIAVEDNAKVSDGIFNLSGQRVNKAQKGIYIVNGKKVLF